MLINDGKSVHQWMYSFFRNS